MGPTPYYNSPPDVPIVIAFAGFTTTTDSTGDYQVLITSHVTGDPATLGAYDMVKTATSLTITPRVTTQDIVVTVIPFEGTGGLQPIEALSKRYRAIDIYTQACEDVHADTAELNHNERFMLLNRAFLGVIGQFYSLVTKDYNTRTEVTIVGSNSASEATIDISGLPMMRIGMEMRVTLEMPQCTTGFADPRTEEEYLAFRSGNSRDRSLIAFVSRPNELRLKKGADIATWGTAYVWYPRIPVAFSADADWADAPDALIDLVILKLAMLLRSRLHKPFEDIQPQIERIIKVLSGSLSAEAGQEEIRQKVQAAL
jgi:hypothetical protein